MKIVLAPDSFKGCLSAIEVCEALERGLRAAPRDTEALNVVKVPMADGGEGTVEALVAATEGRRATALVAGPLGQPLTATFGILGDGRTAIIEMAAASGLALIPPDKRNPLLTSTVGAGELIKAALDLGPGEIIIGIGGSATTDGGAGMAQALGVRMLDAAGEEIHDVAGGRLADIARIDASELDARLGRVRLRVACDVENPLCGEQGAARVYGPQKGATPDMVERLDAGLRHYAERITEDLGVDVADVPGAGAAGGLGAGLVAFCGATLERGVGIVIDAVGLRAKASDADLIITGEGKIDSQTAFGKAPAGVAEVASELGVPVVAVGGSVELSARDLHRRGFDAIVSILNEPMQLGEAMAPDRAREMLAFSAEQILRIVRM